MKNVLLKSIVLFLIMMLLNAQFADWSLVLLKEHPGGIGMYPIGVALNGLIVMAVCFFAVLFFRKSYHSVFRITLLYEVVYLFMLIISGANPFKYFLEKDEVWMLDLLVYANSIIVFGILNSINFIFQKIILSKNENLS